MDNTRTKQPQANPNLTLEAKSRTLKDKNICPLESSRSRPGIKNYITGVSRKVRIWMRRLEWLWRNLAFRSSIRWWVGSVCWGRGRLRRAIMQTLVEINLWVWRWSQWQSSGEWFLDLENSRVKNTLRTFLFHQILLGSKLRKIGNWD